jgi:hypothetical protein
MKRRQKRCCLLQSKETGHEPTYYVRRGNVTQDAKEETPQSPEVHEPETREELDQDNMTHVGDWRKASDGPAAKSGRHLGALEDEMVPVVPPMSGPADLIGENEPNAQGNETGKTRVGEESVDPRDELTPG